MIEMNEKNEKKLIDIFIPNEADGTDSEKKNNNLKKVMDFTVPPKSYEEKTYIILYKICGSSVDDCDGLFDIEIGRTNTYETIKSHLISGMDIDIHSSKIITETKLKDKNNDDKYFLIPFDECISIYAFFNSVSSYYDDEFDIEDFNNLKTDNDSDEELERSKEQKEYEEDIMKSLKEDKFSVSFMNTKSSNGINV